MLKRYYSSSGNQFAANSNSKSWNKIILHQTGRHLKHSDKQTAVKFTTLRGVQVDTSLICWFVCWADTSLIMFGNDAKNIGYVLLFTKAKLMFVYYSPWTRLRGLRSCSLNMEHFYKTWQGRCSFLTPAGTLPETFEALTTNVQV